MSSPPDTIRLAVGDKDLQTQKGENRRWVAVGLPKETPKKQRNQATSESEEIVGTVCNKSRVERLLYVIRYLELYLDTVPLFRKTGYHRYPSTQLPLKQLRQATWGVTL